jgi:hypothetical protein
MSQLLCDQWVSCQGQGPKFKLFALGLLMHFDLDFCWRVSFACSKGLLYLRVIHQLLHSLESTDRM